MSGLELAPCVYMAFGDDQRISDLNQEAASVLGVAKESLLGKQVSELLTKRSRLLFTMHVYPALSLHSEVREVYVSLQRVGGEEIATVMNARSRVVDQCRRFECVFLPMQRRRLFERELIDGRRATLAASRGERHALEKLRLAESQLAVQEQLASLGMLAAGIGHELNNPLSYVAANLELLGAALGKRPDSETLNEMLSDASIGVRRIEEIVRSLRTLSRVEAQPLLRPVELRTVADVAARMAGTQIRQRARLEIQTPSEPVLVDGDEGRLGQIFLNLLINAAQALPEGRSDNLITLRIYSGQEGAVIEVQDNGPGIAAEMHARIFDAFFTTKPAGVGTGLGLSICKTIVASLGGSINVLSEPGSGACFRVKLPLSKTGFAIDDVFGSPSPIRAAVEAPSQLPQGSLPVRERPADVTPEPAEENAAAAQRKSVLIIDDDEHVTRVMARALHDFDVRVVNRSAEVLQLLGERSFDVILCDLMMPTVSGMAIYRALASSDPALSRRMVFLTGGAFSTEAQEFLATVDNPCIRKPFATADLCETCTRVAAS